LIRTNWSSKSKLKTAEEEIPTAPGQKSESRQNLLHGKESCAHGWQSQMEIEIWQTQRKYQQEDWRQRNLNNRPRGILPAYSRHRHMKCKGTIHREVNRTVENKPQNRMADEHLKHKGNKIDFSI
jgi:hypothetical protein